MKLKLQVYFVSINATNIMYQYMILSIYMCIWYILLYNYWNVLVYTMIVIYAFLHAPFPIIESRRDVLSCWRKVLLFLSVLWERNIRKRIRKARIKQSKLYITFVLKCKLKFIYFIYQGINKSIYPSFFSLI